MNEQTDNQPAPVPVAVIDIGSNSIRMAIAQVFADGQLEVLERVYRAVRLGQDTFVAGRLAGQTMAAVIAILRDYRSVIDTYGVQHLRAVATSATREASNSEGFVDRIYMATGFELEVIDPAEEARLMVSAVRGELDLLEDITEGMTLVAEVGGGNALLSVLEDGEIIASESYRLGSIRLQEVLNTPDETPQRAAELIRHQIAGIVAGIRKSLPMSKVRNFVALGGDARFAAIHAGRKLEQGTLYKLPVRKFGDLIEHCAPMPPEQLSRRYNMAFADAETLNPALLVYQALVKATGAEEMIVTQRSMRDGLLREMALAVTGQEDEALARNIIHSAEAIGDKYRYDQEHANCVADLAVQLFDDLRGEHGLGSRHRLLLRVSALLHEVGNFVSGRAHHKHSYYLVSNAEVFGLRGEEIQIVALVTRYHRRSVPKPSHVEYISLTREKRVVVSKLAAILRVADALDRGHAQHIRDFTVEKDADEMRIFVHGATDLTLERRAMARKADLFEDLFGMQIRLIEAPLAKSDRRTESALD
ncbi:MAG: HD domain-containing protein [Planctomycetota bacterium]